MLKILRLGNSLSPRQTRMGGHPSSEKHGDGWFGTGEYPDGYFKEGFVIDT